MAFAMRLVARISRDSTNTWSYSLMYCSCLILVVRTIVGPGQEDQGADGDHGVDEVIAEGLDEAGRGVGGHHPEDGLGPAVPMSMAVVSHPAFILDREFFIIR